MPGPETTNLHQDIRWTAREAFACAYCWAEFEHPENGEDTPESYWQRITERARNDCRRIANERLLLAVARGDAVALPHPLAVSDPVLAKLGDAMELKARHRVWKVLSAVFNTMKKQGAAT